MAAVKRFAWALPLYGRTAHIVYSRRFRVEGEPTACGRLTRVGWTWIAASVLREKKGFRDAYRPCKQCERFHQGKTKEG